MIFERMFTIERRKYHKQTLKGQSARWSMLPGFGDLCPNPTLSLVDSATIALARPRSGVIPAGMRLIL